MRMPTCKLSLCMIVRNEEPHILRCLTSVRPVVDEMIVVDTGSTDKTMELCRAFGAEVYTYAWNDDFAAARNYSLSKASGDWLLWMDADEELSSESTERIKKELSSPQHELYSLRLINYYGASADPNHTTQLRQVRIFRNHKGFRFVNKIHETLNLIEQGMDSSRIGLLEADVLHYGYLDDVIATKRKSERNLSLLQKELDREDVYWPYFYIAAEFFQLKQLDQALHYVNRSIVAFVTSGQIPASMVYKLKYAILAEAERWEEIAKGCGYALQLHSDYVDLWFNQGVALFHLKRFEKAVRSLAQCIALGEEHETHYVTKGTGSYQALYYMGLCCEQLGDREQALRLLRESLSIVEGYPPALEALSRLT